MLTDEDRVVLIDIKPNRPGEPSESIRTRRKLGAFAKTRWATRRIKGMERLVDSGRTALCPGQPGGLLGGQGQTFPRQKSALAHQLLLPRLGQPSFLVDDNLIRLLGPAYEAIAEKAVTMAYEQEVETAGED